jgi:hypothetical protein
MLGDELPKYRLSQPYFYNTTEGGITEAYFCATNFNDHVWSEVIQLIIRALIRTEQLSIKLSGVEFVPAGTASTYGPIYDQMGKDLISAVGNYGEIYERTIDTPRSGCNRLNRAGPQHFPYLFQGL